MHRKNLTAGLSVRPELPADAGAIARVHKAAFGRAAEGQLVEALRRSEHIVFSLVGSLGKDIVGSAVLSPVTVMPTVPGLKMLALGPLGVLPAYQQQGIGSTLMRHAIEQSRADGWHAIVVLGDPEYYRRFGFRAAARFGLTSEFDVADEAFMLLELVAHAVGGVKGVVRYPPEFCLV